MHPTLIHNRGGRTRPTAEIAAAEKIDEFVAWTEQRKTLIGCLLRSLACLDAVA